ncbi:MAG: hypothetical protein GWM98_10910 [Nitrospinaceae bacterium]|nr:hypothetical protein [Nitrospinaceae bacterium]NIR54911.1 hypothetical protein [Nitrospinaceae bacterium]NIS85339.1 hypothetical protein [Nitrospinaceae bacterium]NIT82149.1 hypothetical protein [Nitrospinaceae bacterium]NIU44409.1 hypothetical protein [Nitrospinaceae bacterium]
MTARRIVIIIACAAGVLLASGASAGQTPHPHKHQAHSPFSGVKGEKRVHCVLLGHNLMRPCPYHYKPVGKKDECFISRECEGGAGFPTFQNATPLPLALSTPYFEPPFPLRDLRSAGEPFFHPVIVSTLEPPPKSS